jgi:hypothetical protein
VDNPPVIIIGAPRSGTNMLRDLLSTLPGHGTWPCDEINTIWRHGNLHHPSDRFTPEMATPPVRDYIRGRFAHVARRYGLATVVEKTCANSLRVGFVDRIFDDARYVFIARDGLDATSSAMKRWTAGAELGYLAKKARWVPLRDLPHYGLRFVRNRIHKLTSDDKRLAFWGPALDGMQELVASRSLPEVCAIQWAACVTTALDDLAAVPAERKILVRYEDLVSAPAEGFARLAGFLGLAPTDTASSVVAGISPAMIGKGARDLDAATIETVRQLIEPVDRRLSGELG